MCKTKLNWVVVPDILSKLEKFRHHYLAKMSVLKIVALMLKHKKPPTWV